MMPIFPEDHEELRGSGGQQMPPMEPGVASPAHSDQQRQFLVAGCPEMHAQFTVASTRTAPSGPVIATAPPSDYGVPAASAKWSKMSAAKV